MIISSPGPPLPESGAVMRTTRSICNECPDGVVTSLTVFSGSGFLIPINLKLRSPVCLKTNLPKQMDGGTSRRKALIWESELRSPMITSGVTSMSERIGFAYQTLLIIVMISLHTLSPYLAHLCRWFLPADIWFLGNPAGREQQSQLEHEIYIGSGP